MPSRLPHLGALRAFEAAARHLSFKSAAAELSVTPAAISQQIKTLEEDFGCRLFRRLTRALALTPEGERLAPSVIEAFARLTAAVADTRASTASGLLTVSVIASFATKWLIPRLARFREKHPEIDVRLSADERMANFVTDGVDIGLRYGLGGYDGLHEERIMTESVFPVCAPKLLEGGPLPRELSDLVRYPLLHDSHTDEVGDWERWLRLVGVDTAAIDLSRGSRFAQQDMLLQATIDGHGVALSRTHLVADDLRAGRLVRPFEAVVRANFAYYLVCRKESLELAKVLAFRDWIMSEVALEHDTSPEKLPVVGG